MRKWCIFSLKQDFPFSFTNTVHYLFTAIFDCPQWLTASNRRSFSLTAILINTILNEAILNWLTLSSKLLQSNPSIYSFLHMSCFIVTVSSQIRMSAVQDIIDAYQDNKSCPGDYRWHYTQTTLFKCNTLWYDRSHNLIQTGLSSSLYKLIYLGLVIVVLFYRI